MHSPLPSALSALAISLLLPLAPSPVAADDLQPAMVDYQKVQRHYYRTDMERKAIETRRDEETKKLEVSFTAARETVEKLLGEQQAAQDQLQDPTLSQEKKKEILAAAQKRAAEITTLQRLSAEQQSSVRNLILQQAEEANVAILQEINEAIRTVAEQKGVDFVMNRDFGVRGIPAFPYTSARKILDLTEDVIGKLNQNAPPGWKPSGTTQP